MNILKTSELYTYEYFHHDDVCRLCWNRNSESELIDFYCLHSIVDKIKDCFNINLLENTNAMFPTKMCLHCHSTVENYSVFKNRCSENEKKLKEIFRNYEDINLDKSEVKIENDEIDNNESDFTAVIGTQYQKTIRKKKKKNLIDFKNKIKHIPKSNIEEVNSICKLCKVDYESNDKLKIHNVQHGFDLEGEEYKCYGCEKKWKTLKQRQNHETHCKGLKNGYQCSLCYVSFPYRRIYKNHVKDHLNDSLSDSQEQLFKCTINECVETFKSKWELTKHEAIVHPKCRKKKNYVCESCGRIFSRPDYLHKHKLAHAGVKQHACPHCELRFTQRSSLTVHLRKHTGERPYSCDLCPQRCVSSSNLRAHRRRHLGLKLHECTVCDRKFGYKKSLDEHISSVHERFRTHPCQHCGATYTRLRGLKRHLLAKHRKQDKIDNKLDGAVEVENVISVCKNDLGSNGITVLYGNDSNVKADSNLIENSWS